MLESKRKKHLQSGGGALRQRAHEKLLHAILTGKLEPGSKISEGALAQSLRLSRTPMREALVKLQQEGFVIRDGARGYGIAPLTSREVREIYPILAKLECLALETAGSRVMWQLSDLKKINAQLAKTAGAPLKAIEFDMRWHNRLLSDCPNKRLLRMIDDLKKITQRYERKYMGDPSVLKVSVSHHEEILKHLRKSDSVGALDVLAQNWKFGMDSVLTHLDWA
jgi:DNA-binding GntR family transcriptional regulator